MALCVSRVGSPSPEPLALGVMFCILQSVCVCVCFQILKISRFKQRELQLVLCDNLEGWDGRGFWEGRFKREEIYVYLLTADSHC